jgi:hypothetical protein
VAQLVEHLPSKRKALSSAPTTKKKRRKKISANTIDNELMLSVEKWMELKIMLSEISQTEKEVSHILPQMQNLVL